MGVGMLTADQKLSAARLVAVRRTPYFTTALLSLVPRKQPGLKTMGVTKSMILLWDPEAIDKWSVQETAAVLIHEVGHVLRDHAGRCVAMGADHSKFNIAGDAEINDDIKAMGLTLPGTPYYPETLGCADGLTAEEYYRAMPQQPEPQSPMAGSGWCGSAGGHALPDEPTDDPAARSTTDVARIAKQTAEAVKNHVAQQGRGSVPAGLERWADAALKPPKIRWQDKLARNVRTAVAYRPGAVDLRYSRPARKQAGVGYGAGRPVLPAMVSPVPRIMVAIDTSGSMGQEDLERAVSECAGIFRAIGAAVDFVACDAEVGAAVKARSWQDIARNLKGGGGTDFCPVFEHATKMRYRPEVIVFVTDGDGPAPDVCPHGMKVIWVLVGAYRRVPASFGDVIHIDDVED